MKKCAYYFILTALLLMKSGILVTGIQPEKVKVDHKAQLFSTSKQSKQMEDFWLSMERTSRHLNEHYSAIADDIAHISAQLNSTSPCYQLVESALRAGVSQRWSAKRKCVQ